ncbi:MAG: SLBB domain-containing protein, partial [Rhodospirillaceae bacterium]
PVSVYVTGGVALPGKYAGARTDSLLYYLAMAGGIDPRAGSYRAITVRRGGRQIAQIDLYDFLINGSLPDVQFTDNDTIVVAPQGPTVRVEGDVRRAHLFEVAPQVTTGAQIASIASPQPEVSHVSVRGIRDGMPYNAYLPLAQFADLRVNDGDVYAFQADRIDTTIFVQVQGHSAGPSAMAVRRNARLRDVLDLVEIDPDQAATSAIYLRRQSVAARQDRALEVSLQELQRSVLLTPSSGPTEAEIRVQEAQLVERFIAQVRAVRSEGRVVLANQPGAMDMRVEAGDEIIIPQRSDVVLISGEVRVPQSILYAPGRSVADFVQDAGGFTERADRGKFVVLHQNGAAEITSNPDLRPGDQVLVLPEADAKGMAIFRDIVEIMYRVAVSAGIVVRFWD